MADKYKVHPLTIDDALDLGGILAGGGLAGQAQRALSLMERDGSGAALTAVSSLIMGALANADTRDQMRGFLFAIWKTTEDEQATADDLNVQDRLEPKYENGELKKDSLYYRKLKRFHKLPPSAAVEIGKAVYESDGFTDFLGLLTTAIPTPTTGPPTRSNGNTVSPISKSPASP